MYSNFWMTSGDDENCETRTVVSLKKLCFRFIYRNSQLFPAIKVVMPLDLIEEYHSTIVNSITSDDVGRTMWKNCFLGKEVVMWEEFSTMFFNFLGVSRDENPLHYKMLHSIVKDIADNGEDSVTIETFSKMLEWFGPMGPGILEKIFNIVSKSWFHGNLTHIQAEKLIQKNSNAKKGTYLIRFSSKNRGYFTITVVGRKRTLLHYRVYYNRQNLEYIMGKKLFRSLDEIIGTYHRELCLRNPCSGSKFQVLQVNEKFREIPYLSD